MPSSRDPACHQPRPATLALLGHVGPSFAVGTEAEAFPDDARVLAHFPAVDHRRLAVPLFGDAGQAFAVGAEDERIALDLVVLALALDAVKHHEVLLLPPGDVGHPPAVRAEPLGAGNNLGVNFSRHPIQRDHVALPQRSFQGHVPRIGAQHRRRNPRRRAVHHNARDSAHGDFLDR